ncbi:ABC transporter permease [Rhizobium sp. YIM 134829]|uniref:ABC transporter permease n=1 Tax=Rhizobium sp. YIM 134829 TaxID=3390453 RepID=UPI003979C01D
MILAIVRVMLLGLLRDRGAVLLAFVLPPMIFLIFASIFSGASRDRLPLKLVVVRLDGAAITIRLDQTLRREPSLQVLGDEGLRREDAARLIRQGIVDVGLIIGRRDQANGDPEMTVLVDPSKPMAGALLLGQIQEMVARHLPDLILTRTAASFETIVGPLTSDQQARLATAATALSKEPPGGRPLGSPLIDVRTVDGPTGLNATITYYSGAVAILFLLLSSMQSAATLIEERSAGILDRIAVGPGGTDVVVLGKFLFLTLQGMLQVGLIFTVAALIYKVDVTASLGLWMLITFAAAAAAAGLALVVAAVCTTRYQAQTVSTFLVLVCSAIGGSMVPRFMMPEWAQSLGRFTPNAWAIEAYYGAVGRAEGLPDVFPEIVRLIALAVVGTMLSLIISRMRLRF